MNAIVQTVEDEPTLVFGSLGTIIGGGLEFAAAYGLTMPPAAHAALAVIGGGFVALVTLIAIRSKVTPNAKVTPTGQNVVVAIPAPPAPVAVPPPAPVPAPPVNPIIPPKGV